MTNHSPEPWKWIEKMTREGVEEGEYSDKKGGFVDANGKVICWFGDPEMYYPTDGDEPSVADTDRILACVNFCQGIPSETLAKGLDKLLDDMAADAHSFDPDFTFTKDYKQAFKAILGTP